MKRNAAVGLLLFLSGASAVAQVHPSAPPASEPRVGSGDICVSELKEYCSGVEPGMGRKLACLHDHKAALRPACRTKLNGVEAVEASLAARAHEPVAQFLAEAYARREHGEIYSVGPRKTTPAKPAAPQQPKPNPQ
ncbi:MAG TPA: cysteine rich repeat-containing protein [Rhizomicrobium sp.]